MVKLKDIRYFIDTVADEFTSCQSETLDQCWDKKIHDFSNTYNSESVLAIALQFPKAFMRMPKIFVESDSAYRNAIINGLREIAAQQVSLRLDTGFDMEFVSTLKASQLKVTCENNILTIKSAKQTIKFEDDEANDFVRALLDTKQKVLDKYPNAQNNFSRDLLLSSNEKDRDAMICKFGESLNQSYMFSDRTCENRFYQFLNKIKTQTSETVGAFEEELNVKMSVYQTHTELNNFTRDVFINNLLFKAFQYGEGKSFSIFFTKMLTRLRNAEVPYNIDPIYIESKFREIGQYLNDDMLNLLTEQFKVLHYNNDDYEHNLNAIATTVQGTVQIQIASAWIKDVADYVKEQSAVTFSKDDGFLSGFALEDLLNPVNDQLKILQISEILSEDAMGILIETYTVEQAAKLNINCYKHLANLSIAQFESVLKNWSAEDIASLAHIDLSTSGLYFFRHRVDALTCSETTDSLEEQYQAYNSVLLKLEEDHAKILLENWSVHDISTFGDTLSEFCDNDNEDLIFLLNMHLNAIGPMVSAQEIISVYQESTGILATIRELQKSRHEVFVAYMNDQAPSEFLNNLIIRPLSYIDDIHEATRDYYLQALFNAPKNISNSQFKQSIRAALRFYNEAQSTGIKLKAVFTSLYQNKTIDTESLKSFLSELKCSKCKDSIYYVQSLYPVEEITVNSIKDCYDAIKSEDNEETQSHAYTFINFLKDSSFLDKKNKALVNVFETPSSFIEYVLTQAKGSEQSSVFANSLDNILNEEMKSLNTKNEQSSSGIFSHKVRNTIETIARLLILYILVSLLLATCLYTLNLAVISLFRMAPLMYVQTYASFIRLMLRSPSFHLVPITAMTFFSKNVKSACEIRPNLISTSVQPKEDSTGSYSL